VSYFTLVREFREVRSRSHPASGKCFKCVAHTAYAAVVTFYDRHLGGSAHGRYERALVGQRHDRSVSVLAERRFRRRHRHGGCRRRRLSVQRRRLAARLSPHPRFRGCLHRPEGRHGERPQGDGPHPGDRCARDPPGAQHPKAPKANGAAAKTKKKKVPPLKGNGGKFRQFQGETSTADLAAAVGQANVACTTCAVQLGMSALGQKRTHAPQQKEIVNSSRGCDTHPTNAFGWHAKFFNTLSQTDRTTGSQ
jgi:hypothetical protein